MSASTIQSRYQTTVEKIREFEYKYNREQDSVQLIAVSKTQEPECVAEIAKEGQTDFGENYLQEAQDKIDLLKPLNLNWHFIGHIQSRKAHQIASLFGWVHSVDRIKVAQKLNQSRTPDHPLNILIQVNLQQELSKSGVAPNHLLSLAEKIESLQNLKLRGLMAIPRPESSFKRQRNLYAKLYEKFIQLSDAGFEVDNLSIGMSSDLEAAIAEGATMVRVGTALFGPR